MRFPELKMAIREHSREEYESISSKLCDAFFDYPPLLIARLFSMWFAGSGPLSSLRSQFDSYNFHPRNYVIGHLFAHFLAFQETKFKNPEFFCWPGAWMAGKGLSQTQADLFEKHGALFVDKEDDDSVFPRLQPGRDEATVNSAFQRFYDNAASYDLVGQWIRMPGPFRYDLRWLTANASAAEMKEYMRKGFKSAFGLDPEDAEVLSGNSN